MRALIARANRRGCDRGLMLGVCWIPGVRFQVRSIAFIWPIFLVVEKALGLLRTNAGSGYFFDCRRERTAPRKLKSGGPGGGTKGPPSHDGRCLT
jgi:hypothetical protein